MRLRILTALTLTACLSSCTTWNWWTEGADQEIIVKTDPPLADCTLIRDGVPVAHLYPTPGSVYLPKTKNAITVTCSKPGYRTASAINDSDTNGATVLRVMLGDVFAWPAESITGADNKYDSPFIVTLPKQETPD